MRKNSEFRTRTRAFALRDTPFANRFLMANSSFKSGIGYTETSARKKGVLFFPLPSGSILSQQARPERLDSCLAGEEEEKTKWTVGVGWGPEGFKAWVSREVERIGQLAKKPKRSLFMRKEKRNNTDNQALQDEFRVFLRGVRENIELYLWFALSALIERNADRKFEAKTYHALGMVNSTFQSIGLNFDPSKVTPDLLDFLKDRMNRIASPGAFDIAGNASTIDQGNGTRRFEDSASSLEKMLSEIRGEMGKYYKKNEELEAAATKYMKSI